MLRLTRRSLWEHKRRLLSTVVAIVLGVAFMAGTFVLSDTLNQVLDDLFATANAEVDAQVQGTTLFSDPFGGGDQRNLLDLSLVDDVRAVDGVREAEPFVVTLGFGASNRVLGKDGEALGATQGPPTLIENWYDNESLTAYELTRGRGPRADDEIALNIAAVEDGDYSLGDKVPVLTQFGRKEYTLVGQFLFGSAKSTAGAISANFTLPEAQRLAGIGDKIQQIIVAGDGELTQAQVVQRIAPVLPPTAEALTGAEAAAQLSSDVQSGFGFFQTMLTVFGGIALLGGVFVISNTFSILVGQRARELALLAPPVDHLPTAPLDCVPAEGLALALPQSPRLPPPRLCSRSESENRLLSVLRFFQNRTPPTSTSTMTKPIRAWGPYWLSRLRFRKPAFAAASFSFSFS